MECWNKVLTNLLIQLIPGLSIKLTIMLYHSFSVLQRNSKQFYRKIKHLFKQIRFCIYLNHFFIMNLAMISSSSICFKTQEYGRFKSTSTYKMLIFQYRLGIWRSMKWLGLQNLKQVRDKRKKIRSFKC